MLNRKHLSEPQMSRCVIALVFFCLVASPRAFRAQDKIDRTLPVSVLVTVSSKTKDAPPAIPKGDVFVHQDNQTRKVLDWQMVLQDSSSLDLVVYVDDALDQSVDIPLQDADAFIRALPPNTRVEVAYSLSGVPQISQAFTSDREAAVKALHIPLGRSTASSGLFTGLAEFVKAWPNGADRHAILLVSDGIDLMRGRSELLPGENQDLDVLTDLLRRDGIVVFTIFANGGGARLHGLAMTTAGQSCLQYLSDESGGEAFIDVTTPNSFTPYLDRVSLDLANQYLLKFEAVTAKNGKPELSKLQVGAEVPGIVIHAPAHVKVPAGAPTP